MTRFRTILFLAVVWAAPVFGGVVYEIETTDHEQSPPKVSTSHLSAEGRLLKMNIPPTGKTSKTDVIFRGDRREMLMVDHDTKSYFVIDEATMASLSSQIGSLMSTMEEALKNVPESQRAMVEKMMKQRMPAQAPTLAPVEVRKTGDRETRNGYPCVKYDVRRGDHKIRELWIADWNSIEEGPEVAQLFRDMTHFMSQLMEALSAQTLLPGIADQFADNAFGYLKDIDGFPAASAEFSADGSISSETNLRSAERATLTPADFEPPEEYKRREMTPTPEKKRK